MVKCDYCGVEVALPFKCRYCGGNFCARHHLPENHDCPGLVRGVWRPRAWEVEARVERSFVIPVRRKARRPSLKLGLRFSRGELVGFGAAMLVIFLVETGHLFLWGLNPLASPLVVGVLIGLVAGMVFHELAHRQVARRYGFTARFMVDPLMMLLSLVTALSPSFKIIAPGYVGIFGYPTRREQGIIALAGPLTNIALTVIFLLLRLAVPSLGEVLRWAMIVNLDIAIFNLIPIPPLDGSKIARWSILVWASVTMAVIVPWILLRWPWAAGL